MSRFSGKCDFCDEIGFLGIDRILAAKIFVGNSNIPLKLNNIKDCIPYYPYIVTCSSCSKERGDTIRLTSKSWIDIEEERYGYYPFMDYYRNLLKEEIEKYK